MVKRKRTNNDLQNTKQKTKDRATRTVLKTGSELVWCSGRVAVPAPYVEPVVLLLLRTRYLFVKSLYVISSTTLRGLPYLLFVNRVVKLASSAPSLPQLSKEQEHSHLSMKYLANKFS